MKVPPNIPLNGNELIQFKKVGHSIRLKWVKKTLCLATVDPVKVKHPAPTLRVML